MEQTELLIVEQLKKGNERAYKFLYEQHYQILCHVAAQYVKDDFLAETIVGDVIFHLWEIRESLEINNNLRSYLLQSVKHRCMDYLKSQYHQKELTAHGEQYPYIKKYCHPHDLTGNTDDNWPVYRYSEALLYLAEALNEQGKTTEAATYLNQVRNRAGLSNTTASNQSEMRTAIMNERRVELAFENKRWLDLIHYNVAEQVMKAYGERVKANPQAYYFPEGYGVAPQSYTNIRILFPLPAAEAALTTYF